MTVRTVAGWVFAGGWTVATASAVAAPQEEANAPAPPATAATQPREAAEVVDADPGVPVVTADEVVITASRREILLRELPASATVIREPASAKPAAKNFLDMFADDLVSPTVQDALGSRVKIGDFAVKIHGGNAKLNG